MVQILVRIRFFMPEEIYTLTEVIVFSILFQKLCPYVYAYEMHSIHIIVPVYFV